MVRQLRGIRFLAFLLDFTNGRKNFMIFRTPPPSSVWIGTKYRGGTVYVMDSIDHGDGGSQENFLGIRCSQYLQYFVLTGTSSEELLNTAVMGYAYTPAIDDSDNNNKSFLMVFRTSSCEHGVYNCEQEELTTSTSIRTGTTGSPSCCCNVNNEDEKNLVMLRLKNKEQTKVSFEETCRVKLGLNLEDYTETEIAASWYSKEEYSVITRKCTSLIKNLIKGDEATHQKYCVRGLERMTPEAADKRTLARMDAYIAVLNEQSKRRGYSIDHDNTEEIARKYRETTAMKCQQAAHEIGLRDALAAARANRRTSYC